MGFFKKEDLPAKNVSENDIAQNRLNIQSEIDQLDFKIAKAKKENELRKHKSPGKTIKRIGSELSDALSIISDEPLKNATGTEKKSSSPLEDPFGKSLF